jgi:hypothetical protein
MPWHYTYSCMGLREEELPDNHRLDYEQKKQAATNF